MTPEERRERNRLYNIEWRAKNKEKVKESQRLFNEKHPERRTEISKKFRECHKEKRSLEYSNYRKTMAGRASALYRNYVQHDSKAGREKGTITQKWIIEHIFSSKCVYCGDDNWKHLGADRIDNSKPHNPENCVCSCGICNVERAGKKMSFEEFIEYRKEHPIILGIPKYDNIVEVDGKKVIRKKQP